MLVALVLVAVAVGVPLYVTRGDEDSPSGASPSATADPSDTGDLSAVQEYDDLSNDHLAPGEEYDYPQSPPVGGQHAPYWLECGAYDEEVPEVNAVHDLEHGTTWITYRDDLVDGEDIEALLALLPDNGILSPYADQEAPVVVTVWGRQLALTGPDDSRLPLFLQEYGAGDTAPEPFASCHGGIPADLLDQLGNDGGGVDA